VSEGGGHGGGERRDVAIADAISKVTAALGSVPAIIGSVAIIVVWALTGPIFGFSDTWQLIVNTATTIITFNMVFVIQNTQNRDGRAIQTKLDAIIEALTDTDDRLVGLEDLPEKDIERRQAGVRADAQLAGAGDPPQM
jgi:low affinity Fe/Cu permease